jgi:lipopolysaccharide/colanic/teichoic acid biosynthesis glycosyltransferase
MSTGSGRATARATGTVMPWGPLVEPGEVPIAEPVARPVAKPPAGPAAEPGAEPDLARLRRARVDQALARLRVFGWQSAPEAAGKRVIEFLLAVVLLVLTAPILALLCLIVRLDSPGPVLFRQWRVGKGGRLFRFTKLRTLYVDAKERWPELYAYDYTPTQLDELKFKVPNDPRVTRAGQWLRKSTLDELPNLWHVLNGDMALVGPRPEIPEMLPYYTHETLRKFSVRPGVTGLAQVSGRGHLTFHDTVDFDVQYVDDRSTLRDVRILVLTLVRAVQRHGAF